MNIGDCFRCAETMLPWVDLKSYWAWGNWMADCRHEQKKKYKTHNPMNAKPDHVGMLGEIVYSLETGEELDWELKEDGDGGGDFGDVNVKTSTTDKAQHLIEFLNPNHWAERYVFVVVDMEEKKGAVVGWASKYEMQGAEVIDFGYGERLAVPLSKLRSAYLIPEVVAEHRRRMERSGFVVERHGRHAAGIMDGTLPLGCVDRGPSFVERIRRLRGTMGGKHG